MVGKKQLSAAAVLTSEHIQLCDSHAVPETSFGSHMSTLIAIKRHVPTMQVMQAVESSDVIATQHGADLAVG